MSQQIINDFHKLYYEKDNNSTWANLSFMGHRILKCPLDLWVYQEIFHEVRPDLIIETGTHSGGSTLYWASLCSLFQTGRVVSIDINAQVQPEHPLVTYINGDSVSPQVLSQVKDLIQSLGQSPVVLVNLDSLHMYDHVSRELEVYHPFVTPGSYLIVEDTNLCGHPIEWNRQAFGDKGPWEAANEFLLAHKEFEVDLSREKLLLTFNPQGYLKRKY